MWQALHCRRTLCDLWIKLMIPLIARVAVVSAPLPCNGLSLSPFKLICSHEHLRNLYLLQSTLCFVKIPVPDDFRDQDQDWDRDIPDFPPYKKLTNNKKKHEQKQKFFYKFFWQFFQMTHIDENINNLSLSFEWNSICKHNCSIFWRKFDF